MKFDNIFRSALLALAGTASLMAQSATVRLIPSAYAIVDQSGSYMLSGGVFAGRAGDAITISGNSVTLDLNGQEILCPGSGVGIRINNAQNVIVRNGSISNCLMGIVVMNSANVKIENMSIRGMDSAPPEAGMMVVQSRNVAILNNNIYNTALGLFIRGGRSFGNRIEGNNITAGGVNSALGICYNPTDTDRVGPQGDLIKGNVIRGFGIPISLNATSSYNVVQANTLFYKDSAFRSDNKTNLDMDNIKVLIQ